MTSMDDGAHAWLITVAADHFWRVPKWYEFDDLIQDGYTCWYRCVQKYETDTGRVRSRAHLMRLFKTSFLNHIHDLSKNCTVARCEVLVEDIAPQDDSLFADAWDALGVPSDLSDYRRMIAEAPAKLRPLLEALMITSPSPSLRARYRVNPDGTRDTLNRRLCRLIKADPSTRDLVFELRTFLTS